MEQLLCTLLSYTSAIALIALGGLLIGSILATFGDSRASSPPPSPFAEMARRSAETRWKALQLSLNHREQMNHIIRQHTRRSL